MSNSNRFVVGLDGVCALGLVLFSALYENIARFPSGSLAQFLELRVTLLNVLFAAAFVVAWTSCFGALNLYRVESSHIWRKLKKIFLGCGLMAAGLSLYLVGSHTKGPTGRIAVAFFFAALVFEILRVVGGSLCQTWIASRNPRQVVILGSGKKAGMAWRQIRTRHHSTVKLVGFVDDRSPDEMAPDIADRYLGTIDQLSDLLLRNVVDQLLIALPTKTCYDHIQRAIRTAEQVGVEVLYMQDLYVTTLKQRALDEPEMFTDIARRHESYALSQAIKRFLDVAGALIGMVVLLPLFLLTAVVIKLSSPGPIFFSQHRYGYRRRLFRMYKFRSMVANASDLLDQLEDQNEAVGPIFKIRHDPRITPIGRFLRTSSIDELPQLWNVLVGDMSLVGPRPMTTRDVALFSEATLMRRFSVKPGITGLWQVSGRSDATFDQWIKFDFSYIDDWSLGLDMRILARTVTTVLRRSGAA
ncbi:MAG TPA: sugar transferase [Terriglobales bacterium]|nr:sugar transferase [Terriglobales bacterium]